MSRLAGARLSVLAIGLAALVGAAARWVHSREEIAMPRPSAYAPAADLERQAATLLEELREDVHEAEEYGQTQQQRVIQYANTVAAVALVLGNHDEPTRWKHYAGQVIDAAVVVAEHADDRAAARRALAALELALQAEDAAPVPWTTVGDIRQLMLAVPVLNKDLRRGVFGRRFERSRERSAALAATLAAIAQVSILDDTYCVDDAAAAQWDEYCRRMRERAAACQRAIRAGDQSAAKEAMREMTRACDDCHDAFQI